MSGRRLAKTGLPAAAIGVASLLAAACGSATPHATPAGAVSAAGRAGSSSPSGQGSGKVAEIRLSPAQPAGQDELAAAAGVIRRRAGLLGLQHDQVSVSGHDVVITGPEPSQAQLALLAAGGVLLFRPVLLVQPYIANTTAASASVSATPIPTAPAAAAFAYGNASLVNAATMQLFDELACKPGPNANTVDDSWKATVGYTMAQDQYDDLVAQIVSCDASGMKYVLGPAVFGGADVTSVHAVQLQNTTQWAVDLTLDGKATAAFDTLTTSQYNSYYPGMQSGNLNDQYLDSTAVVLDGNVLTAPATQAPVTGGQVEFTGGQPNGFSQAAAQELAALLGGGPLPVSLRVSTISARSP